MYLAVMHRPQLLPGVALSDTADYSSGKMYAEWQRTVMNICLCRKLCCGQSSQILSGLCKLFGCEFFRNKVIILLPDVPLIPPPPWCLWLFTSLSLLLLLTWLFQLLSHCMNIIYQGSCGECDVRTSYRQSALWWWLKADGAWGQEALNGWVSRTIKYGCRAANILGPAHKTSRIWSTKSGALCAEGRRYLTKLYARNLGLLVNFNALFKHVNVH